MRGVRNGARNIRRYLAGLLLAVCLPARAPASSPGVAVSARVTVTSPEDKAFRSPVVLWLTSVSDPPSSAEASAAPRAGFRLVQKHKRFDPHILVVPVGATVQFPNLDPFFHNVFSLFNGKRFDLGLYEAGSTRSMRFDRPGISYIFCNIHPEMSAVIVVLKTPYYGMSNAAGEIRIPDVPPGRYSLEIWQEAAEPEGLKKFRREVNVSIDHSFLGAFHLRATARTTVVHKNKYGRDYDDPASPNPLYDQP